MKYVIPELLPNDEHNQTLVSNVHPGDWVNPTPKGRYNLIAIGGGAAGLVSAVGAAGLGARVALVERHFLGGDCLNFGCVPSKAVIASARAAAGLRKAHQFGVQGGGEPVVDFGAAMERMRLLRSDISKHDSAQRFTDLGVDIYLGHATFVAKDALEVDGVRLEFSRAVIATGGTASGVELPGLEAAGYRTNATIYELTDLPRRLIVLGAGLSGCEMGQAFRALGAEVTIVTRGERILPMEDPDASRILTQRFEQEGISLHTGANVVRVEKRPGGAKAVVFDCGTGEQETVGDELLVAVGRTPNTDGLGLDAAGVAHNAQGVIVDDRLQTSNKRIYAAGDICSKFKFTHAADAMARIVIANALFLGRRKVSHLTIPWCTYTSPEVAHVGIHQHEADAMGGAAITIQVDLAKVDRLILDGETEGFAKVHVGKKGRILGATIVGSNAGDLIGAISMAMTAGIGLGTISGTVFPYPTRAEVLRQLGDAYNRKRLTPGVRKWFSRWFRFCR